MFSKTVLLAQVKTTAARVAFFLGCIAVLALQGPGVARGQPSDVRTELLKALELQSGVAESLGRTDLAATLDNAIEQVHFVSDADLVPLEGAIDGIQNYSGALQRLDAAIQEAAAAEAVRSVGTPSVTIYGAVPPPSLTPPPYFDGGITGLLCRLPDATIGVRNNTEIVLDARIALGVAKTAWAGVEVACGLDVVALASGGLGAVACGALAVAVAAAEEILDGFQRCDETIDEAHLDAAFFRAEDNFILGTHTHEDLATHDTNIDADLATHDADVKALLAKLQNSVDENQRKLDQIIDLLLTPQGRRDGFPQKPAPQVRRDGSPKKPTPQVRRAGFPAR